MKIAIFESIVTPGGHEHDFDKLLVAELSAAGHDVEMIVPEGYPFKLDYGVPVRFIKGPAVSYTGVSGLKKILLSATREIRRVKWFDQLAVYAKTGDLDAIIIPTATYRFLRSIRFSQLKHSPIPIIPVMHGINPKEAPKFFEQVEKLQQFAAVQPTVITLGETLLGRNLKNINLVYPPYFPPLPGLAESAGNDVLTLGFFGQYRREKNLDAFLDVFLNSHFTTPVRLLVQGATSLPEDAADFQRIQQKYSHANNIVFWHRALIGKEWHAAIASVDALIMPYSAERYLYHWSAMLFTAIGFQKPVLAADTINPEVLAQYTIGVAFTPKQQGALQQALEKFINTYPATASTYSQELARAREAFAPARFARDLLRLKG